MKQPGLFDPIERGREMHDEECLKYVRIHQRELDAGSPQVTEGDIEKLKEQFYNTHSYTYAGFVDYIWQSVEPRLRASGGLTQFTLDNHGASSDFFFPWLLEIAESPSGALELAYGAGFDVVGRWEWSIPPDDPIMSFVRDDPMLVYNRERQLHIADLVTRAQAADVTSGPPHVCKVIDFGAGRLAWARWHGFSFSPSYQQIYAFDRDRSIKPAELFYDELTELGLHYYTGDLESEIKNPICQDADLVILGGVASYYPFETFVQHVIRPIHQLLVPGGVFFFDLQIDCPCLQRNAAIFDWPPMYLDCSITAAIDIVEQARRALWQDGHKFSAEYAIDTYNMSPGNIMVTFTKICY